ncbi:5-formyltetrahydrofolate cyclo-ligase [uncultured Croceitalea sp.]|uniref:5-formyltetrahydrofolate cyclo-ligase n=1 Tax=uncultured Croceitalea sp. TaxID=1798908 RepID=UPI003305E4DC
MQKIELRKAYRNKRENLSFKTIQSQSLKISNNILQMKIWSFLYYHTFLTITQSKEVDTSYLITLLQGKDKNIIVPKTISDNQLENYLLTDNTLFKKSKWNIPEPVEGIIVNEKQLEVIFIPLLAFDKTGNRVGYGKGFYDTLLAKCNTDVLKIGLSFFEPEERIEDISEHDVPLDFCVTPDVVYEF